MRPSADSLFYWTGSPCVYRCATCPIDAARAPAAGAVEELHRQLIGVRERAGRLVVLVGGEPSMRPDVLRLIATIRADHTVPGMITTGVALCQPSVRSRLRRAGLAYLRVQMFGVGAAHDGATAASGAYAKIAQAVGEWVSETAGACDVDVVLNYRDRSFDSLTTEVEQLARDISHPAVQITVTDDGRDPDGLRAAVSGLADWNDDEERPILAVEGVAEPAEPASCLAISLPSWGFLGSEPEATCLGAVGELATRARSVARRVRSNSFNFVRTGAVAPYADAAASCTAHSAGAAESSQRGLWLVGGDTLELYATDTGDFDPGEISRIKTDWSHLFVDRAAAGELDDFREGMRRVLPDPVCGECANRDSCARRYRAVEGQPFAAEEQWIADYVRRLRGRVLDVGCGEQLYRDEIIPLVRSGLVTYTGLDPDQPSLAEWREVLPEGRFIEGGIEDFCSEPASYDRLLCLRSLNHVTDLDEAIARMADAVKPGGQLLIVETTPFAMLRDGEQVAAADRAPRAGHQHFRNVTSLDVLPYARRRGLGVLHHHPVGLSATNEWILLLEKWG